MPVHKTLPELLQIRRASHHATQTERPSVAPALPAQTKDNRDLRNRNLARPTARRPPAPHSGANRIETLDPNASLFPSNAAGGAPAFPAPAGIPAPATARCGPISGGVRSPTSSKAAGAGLSERRPRTNATGCGPTCLTCPAPGPSDDHEHPAANLFKKQLKSFTFSVGAVVELSQFAYGSAAAKRFRKQLKSFTFSTGGVLEPSQFA